MIGIYSESKPIASRVARRKLLAKLQSVHSILRCVQWEKSTANKKSCPRGMKKTKRKKEKRNTGLPSTMVHDKLTSNGTKSNDSHRKINKIKTKSGPCPHRRDRGSQFLFPKRVFAAQSRRIAGKPLAGTRVRI